MVFFTSFSRQPRYTMASSARLFMLLAIAIPTLAVSDVVPEVFLSESTLNDNYLDELYKESDISDSCPPFGQPDNRTSVTVMDTTSPAISGYASMVPLSEGIAPSFNLWLLRPRTDGRRLHEKNIEQYLFECWSKAPGYSDEYKSNKVWLVKLYDRTGKWSKRPNFICALYEMVNENPSMIKMVISANASCAGLWQRMNQSEHTVPEGLRRFADGSVAHHFSKDSPQTPVWRKKRSEVQGGGCRFPDWSQGSWKDLKVDGSMFHYEPVFHEKDHIDYGEENDDGKDTGAKIIDSEQHIQRSQRHAPVEISEIDHSSPHYSQSHRDRRSITHINTVKTFRTQTSTVQNNTSDNNQLRNTSNLSNQHDDSEKKANNEKKRCYCYTDFEVLESKNDKDQMELFNKGHEYFPTTQKYPGDLNQSSNFPLDFIGFRKKRQLDNQNDHVKIDTKLQQKKNYRNRNFEPYTPGDMHIPKILDEKNTFSTKKKITNSHEKISPLDHVLRKKRDLKHLIKYSEEEIDNKKKRCYCYNNFEGLLSKKDEFTIKLVDEMIKLLATTKKYPENLKEKPNSSFDFVELPKENGSGNQNDHGMEDIKHRQKRSYRNEQFKNPIKKGDPMEPSSKVIEYFGTTQNPTALNRKRRSVDADLDDKYKSTKDVNEESITNMEIIDDVEELIRGWFILQGLPIIANHTWDQFNENIGDMNTTSYHNSSLLNQLQKTNATTQNYPEDLKKESTFSFDFYQFRKKREALDRHDHGTEGINHRKKRCNSWWLKRTTSTERYRDKVFENPKTGDPTEPSFKPQLEFGTTKDPSLPNRKTRSIIEDVDTIYQLRKKSESSAEHDHGTESTNHRKKRCNSWWLKRTTSTERYRDKVFENPKTGDPTEPSFKPQLEFGTTKDPSLPNRNKRSIIEDVDTIYQLRKKSESSAEHDHGTESINHRKKRCNSWWLKRTTSTERYRDKVFENPKTGDPTEPSFKPQLEFGTTKDPSLPNRNKRSIIEDVDTIYQLRKKSESSAEHDHGTESTNHRKKRCNSWWLKRTTSTERYRDKVFENPKTGDPTEPSFKPQLEFGTTKDPSLPNRKTRSIIEDVDTIYQLRKKSESSAEHDHGTESINHRKKRCNSWWLKRTTSTERYRDKVFENPKTGDPTEPSFKPQLEFGTTKDPSLPNRNTRSIIEDVDTVNDEEEALKKIKIIDQVNRRIRWWNIVRAIESIRLHALQQSDGNIKYEEYEVFPDNTQILDSVRYFKDAETRGISYKQSLLNWRSLERAHRQRLAEVAYTAFPGQNHPDVVMRDFDQTFDGIEYDFNPMYPEGTVDDPTAYRALTLPDGYRIEPRLSRRTTFEQKQSRDSSESTTVITSHSEVVPSNTLNERIDQGNTLGLNQRMRRSSAHQNQQQQATTTFTWRCEMTVDDDEKQLPQLENGAKFLTYGGHVVDNNDMTENDQHNEQDSNMSYGCLWLVPRGPNILEFSVIGTGMPSKNQSMQTFARQLCSENRGNDKDTSVQNDKKLRPHQPRWITETRTDDHKPVQVRCPVPPGIVFYGVVPAPPPNLTVSTNKDQISPRQLCAKLVSSADDCTTGQMGPVDQMKYTVSECVEQDSITGTSQTMVTQQTIYEEKEYQCLGQWTEPQEHISPVAGEKPVMLTYTYLKRLSPVSKEGSQYECYVGTPIPNDEGLNPETTITILFTEAGTNTKCSRLSDPYRSGMKLVGTKIKKEGACKGSAQSVEATSDGSWFSLKPQQIFIPAAENGIGAWLGAPSVPVVAQVPTTMMPILTGRHTGGNGATFISRQNEQARHPQSANLPSKTNYSIRSVADKRIVILAVILFAVRRFIN